MKKIAFLINSLGKGGAERVAKNLAEHFHENNYEVLLVTSRKFSEEYEIGFSIKRILLEEEIKGAPFGRIGKIPARIRGLKKIWQEEKPDIIVSFIGKMNLYAMLSVKNLKIPVIVSVRSAPDKEYPSVFQRILADTLFQKAAGIVFQTAQAQKAFSRKVQEKSCVLPNILDKSFIQPRYEGERKNEIVMVGRMNRNKNHAMVIRAFSEIEKEHSAMRLVIYGAGLQDETDTEPELRKLVKELGIEDKVIFRGRQTHIREKIEKSRIFVLSSDYEGMPNALLEAMATGLCVISTDCPCGGPGTVIKNGENGILIPVGDEQALKQALRKVLADRSLEERLGREAAKLAEELQPEKVCIRWQKEIESRAGAYVDSQSEKKTRR